MTQADQNLSDLVKQQMNRKPIHESWEGTYRTEGNERFFEHAYDYFVGLLGQPEGSRALDIGCGIGANSVRLARRGYLVSAADYSEPILEQTWANVQQKQLADRISIGREDILALSFPDNHFDLVLCWGVLMHVPDADRAISELVRVAKPGGYIVFEEINMFAPEALLMRASWRALKRGRIAVRRTASGFEQTSDFAGEKLFWRHVDPRWLKDSLESRSCSAVARGCGMMSDLYMYAPGKPLKSLVHSFNRFWLRRVNRPELAYHNIFVFRKR